MQPFELPDNQRLAIGALTAGEPRSKAAQAAGVNARTLQRWLEEPAFLQALYIARQQIWQDLAVVLHAKAHTAVAAIITGLEAPDFNLRLRAAKMLLDMNLKNLKAEAHFTQAILKIQAQADAIQAAASLNARTPESLNPPASLNA